MSTIPFLDMNGLQPNAGIVILTTPLSMQHIVFKKEMSSTLPLGTF